jgi:DNA polymerase lambda
MQELIPPAAIEKPRKGVIALGSSKLCLEVKERVAKHAAMKQRDKVIPLGSQGVELRSPSRRDVREILLQEASTARATSVSVPRVITPSHSPEAERLRKPKNANRNHAQLSVQKSKSQKKVKQAPISPAEYVQQLLDGIAAEKRPKKSSSLFLEGKCIFYIGGDMHYAGERTRGRMDLVS